MDYDAPGGVVVITRKKILIVDDDCFIREFLKDTLDCHYQVFEASNGNEALSMVSQCCPDLVVLDVEMPKFNGIEVCESMKQNPATQGIPVILVSSHNRKEYIYEGLHAGADDYLTKPVNPSEFLARVDTHLRLRRDYAQFGEKDLRVLLELTEAVSATRNPLIILQTIVKKIAEAAEVSRCSIVSLGLNGELVVKASNDLPFDREITIDLSKYPEIQKALQTKRTVIINDVKHAPEMQSVAELIRDQAFNSLIVIPILKKDSVIGTFLLRAASPLLQGISDRLMNLCQLIAHISTNALENAILIETMKNTQEYLEERVLRDGLTGLYNHQYFYTCLEREFSRATRYDLPLSCVLFDIDNFKAINDQFGHVKGDEVLRSLGQQIAGVFRDSDIVARYGGEEFAVILPNTNKAGARDLASRLLEAIRGHSYAHLDGKNITVSLGVSIFDGGIVNSYNEIVIAADEAMYKAKAAGKDCVVFADALSSVPPITPACKQK